jgi:hypothetical protein
MWPLVFSKHEPVRQSVLDSWHILHLHDKQVKQQVRRPAGVQFCVDEAADVLSQQPSDCSYLDASSALPVCWWQSMPYRSERHDFCCLVCCCPGLWMLLLLQHRVGLRL